MADFQSNITFGGAPAPATCNGLCRVRDNCPTCREAGRLYTERGVAQLESIANGDPTEHCCESTPGLCPLFREPRTCEACDHWLHS